MDTADDSTGSGDEEAEVAYLRLLGKSVARCVEDILVVSVELADDATKENGKSGAVSAIQTAIERSEIDSKVRTLTRIYFGKISSGKVVLTFFEFFQGVACLYLFDDAKGREELVATLCNRIRELAPVAPTR